MAQEWNISPRGHVCALCQRTFEERQVCVSALLEAGDDYERWDCHLACWDSNPPEWKPFSLWESEYEAPVPRPAREEPVRKDTAEMLLRRLIVLEDPAMRNVVYVLAVMLERGKQLVERGTKPHKSGGVLRVYEHKHSGDTFVVLDPALRLDQLEQVQYQVVELLSGTQTLSQPASPESGSP